MNRLKELRRKHGMTLKDLGQEVDMWDNTLSQYENEKRHPKYSTWKKLADYFGVSVDYLRGTDPYKIYVYYTNYGDHTFLVVAKSRKDADKMLLSEIDPGYELDDFEVTTYPVNEAMIEEL